MIVDQFLLIGCPKKHFEPGFSIFRFSIKITYFFGRAGRQKIRLFQLYKVLCIHYINAICIFQYSNLPVFSARSFSRLEKSLFDNDLGLNGIQEICSICSCFNVKRAQEALLDDKIKKKCNKTEICGKYEVLLSSTSWQKVGLTVVRRGDKTHLSNTQTNMKF